MSLTIEELDATVRAFYEGRGETVRAQGCVAAHGLRDHREANETLSTAKASSGDTEPGRPYDPRARFHATQH